MARLLARMDAFRTEGRYCDLTLRPGGTSGHSVRVHSLVMAAASPGYFDTRITRWSTRAGGDGGDGGAGAGGGMVEITIPEIDARTLDAVLVIAYGGTVASDADVKGDALPLLAAVLLLDMNDARVVVEEWVSERIDTSCALRVRHMAAQFQLGELRRKASEYVDRHLAEVSGHEDWLVLSADDVEEVLARDELRPGGEMHVFHALARWTEGQAAATSDAGGGGSGSGAAGGQGAGEEEKEMVEQEAKEQGDERTNGGEHVAADEDGVPAHQRLLTKCVRVSQMTATERSTLMAEMKLSSSFAAMEGFEWATSPPPAFGPRADASHCLFVIKKEQGTNTSQIYGGSGETDTWTTVLSAPPSTVRAECGVVALDEKVYLVGGSSLANMVLACVECFDSLTGQWSQVADMQRGRYKARVAALDGAIYVVGGVRGGPSAGGEDSSISTIDRLDVSTGVWSDAPPPPPGALGIVSRLTAVAVLNGKMYLAGGLGDDCLSLKTVYSFDPTNGQWTAETPMLVGRHSFGLAVLDGKMYAVGGKECDGGEVLRSVECFNPLTVQWSQVTSMCGRRWEHEAVGMNGKLFVLGGSGGGRASILASVECYDPLTEAWSDLANVHALDSQDTMCVVGAVAMLGAPPLAQKQQRR